ncbi:MAG: hypothetical protein H6729_09520 [Deltaproteobacteria bacterium]|nr:hypothetical protein [Deltaproteobacteria bacterium]
MQSAEGRLNKDQAEQWGIDRQRVRRWRRRSHRPDHRDGSLRGLDLRGRPARHARFGEAR